MRVEVLDAVREAEKWREIMARLPKDLRDVYFTPEYVRLHCLEQDARALLFVVRQADTYWLYPFVFRPILQVGGQPVGEGVSDIESAYGYGGPLATSQDSDFLGEAHRAFADWCRLQGVVAEFIRLHPLLDNHRWLSGKVEVLFDRHTGSLGLAALSAGKMPFNSTVRNMLRRAERAGCSVEIAPANEEAFSGFVALYRRTMERLQADRYYYFTDGYFKELNKLVDTAGKLVFVKHEGQVLVAAVFLQGAAWLHYHLSCTDSDRSVPGAVNLLIYGMAQAGEREGLVRCHLGGGRTAMPDDSLFMFKKAMATDIHDFRIGRRIHNRSAYQELRTMWNKRFPELVARCGNNTLCYRVEGHV